MASLATNQVEILIQTVANNIGLDQTIAKLGVLQAEAEARMAAVNAAAAKVSLAFVGIGIAVGVAVGESVKQAADFQTSMMLLQAHAGASAQEVAYMTDKVKQLALEVGTGPKNLADGLYYVESAGYRGAQALDILRAAAEGAKIGHADLESVSRALVATMNANIKGVNSSAQAMGYLNATVGAGMMRMQDLADSLSSGILPAANSFGLNIKDVTAALATMTDLGVPAIDAATRLRMTFSLMGAPTNAAAKALKEIGLSTTALADDMRNKGLSAAIEDLNKHLKDSGMTASQQAEIIAKAFGGGRSSATILTLMQNIDRLNAKYKQIGETTDHFGNSWNAIQDTFNQKMDKFKASIDVLVINLGTALLPVLTKFVDFLNTSVIPAIVSVTNWLDKHRWAVAILAGIITGMLIIGIIALVVWIGSMVAGMITAIGIIAGLGGGLVGIAAIITGSVITAIILLKTYWNDLGNTFVAVGNWMKATAIDVANTVIGMINGIIGAINTLVQGAASIANKVPGVHLNVGKIDQLSTLAGGSGLGVGNPQLSGNSSSVVNNRNINITNNNSFATPGSSQQLLSNINFDLATVR